MIRTTLDLLREYKDVLGVFVLAGVQVFTIWRVNKVSSNVQDIHIMVNSRLSELLSLTAKASKAEGVKQGEDKARGS